jgi:hypothetical protein
MGEIKQQRYNYSKRNATAMRRMKRHNINRIADRKQSFNTRRTTTIVQNITFYQKQYLSHPQQQKYPNLFFVDA